jgi:PAS domain S-box-containing protein
MGGEPIRILHLEDSPIDAELVDLYLGRGGLACEIERVSSRKGFIEALERGGHDLVIADYMLPDFDGMSALGLVRRTAPDLPFIFVSGALGEETATEALRNGATDYVLKQRLERLASAARRAVSEARISGERRRAEEALTRLSLAIEEIRDYAIFMLDPEGRVSSWNRGSARLLQYSEAEILGCPAAILMAPDDGDGVALLAAEMRQAAELGRTGHECPYLRKDGSRFWASGVLSAARDADGRTVGYSMVLRDISDLRTAEEERTALLESERVARAEAEKASRLKDEFLATLSHELRTPLNSILGWSQLIRRGKPTLEQVLQGIEIIERNARTQARIVEDLLDMSRIVSGKLVFSRKEVQLAGVVRQAVEAVQPSAEAKSIDIRLSLDEGAHVWGDAGRLQQVAWNLLSNAVKFTPERGRIDVTLSQDKDGVVFSVRDTGQGIGADFLPHIFERFRQANASSTRRLGGLGLGLAIVCQLVELHGGLVKAESEGEGEGATFTISLPAIRSDGQAGPEGIDEDGFDGRIAGVTVLLVEDEPDSRHVIGEMLRQHQAEVIEAASAGEAFSLLGRHRPRVLVSDIGMPDEDGLSLIRRVRALPPEDGGAVRAIALTAYARQEDRERALSAGFHRHITKPVTPARIVAAIGDLLAQDMPGTD